MLENEEISDKERQKLLNRLHKSLFWVGEAIPRKVRIKGEEVKLHEVVWEIVNKSRLNEDDFEDIDLFLELLCEKEQEYENRLQNAHLTSDEAKDVFDRAAGTRRAIMDLKELITPSKRKAILEDRRICKDVETDEWDNISELVRKNNC